MNDDTPFQTTLAIDLNDSNKSAFWHCLGGVLEQTLPFDKVCVVDSCTEMPGGYMSGFLKKARHVCPQAPLYKRVGELHRNERSLQNVGWQFVNEAFTPSTPLFIWLRGNHFMGQNFNAAIKRSFEEHRYTCCYKFQELPLSGHKADTLKSFCVTSQVFNEIIYSTKYDGNNLAALIDNLVTRDDEWKLPPPWVAYNILSIYVEELRCEQ